MNAITRIREARNAFILAHMLPAVALRHTIGAAQAGRVGQAVRIMAAVPELEDIAADHIIEVLTNGR